MLPHKDGFVVYEVQRVLHGPAVLITLPANPNERPWTEHALNTVVIQQEVAVWQNLGRVLSAEVAHGIVDDGQRRWADVASDSFLLAQVAPADPP